VSRHHVRRFASDFLADLPRNPGSYDMGDETGDDDKMEVPTTTTTSTSTEVLNTEASGDTVAAEDTGGQEGVPSLILGLNHDTFSAVVLLSVGALVSTVTGIAHLVSMVMALPRAEKVTLLAHPLVRATDLILQVTSLLVCTEGASFYNLFSALVFLLVSGDSIYTWITAEDQEEAEDDQ